MIKENTMIDLKALTESIKKSHISILLISLVSLLLVITPNKIDYLKALEEAKIIDKLDIDDYETYIRGFQEKPRYVPGGYQGGETKNYGVNIAEFISKLEDMISPPSEERIKLVPSDDFDWSILLITKYELPPTNGSIKDWLLWINSSSRPYCFAPKWETARLSASRHENGTIRFFSVRDSVLGTKEYYRFRGYIEYGKTLSTEQWWMNIDSKDYRDLFEDKLSREQIVNQNRSFFEGDVKYGDPQVSPGTISQWLKARGKWEKLIVIDSKGEQVLPGLHTHWEELKDKSLKEAISIMEEKQNKINDISLFGLLIPGQVCIIIIPLFFMIFSLLLYIDFRYLNNSNQSGKDKLLVIPWFLFYNDKLSRFTSYCTIVLLPSFLSLGLIIRYFSALDISSSITGFIFFIISSLLQILTILKINNFYNRLNT
jgi:hypothetical protein